MADACLAPEQCLPGNILEQVAPNSSGCLAIVQGKISWYIYVQNGRLVYATNSLEPFERLDRQLRQLKQDYPHLRRDLRREAFAHFASELQNSFSVSPEYRAILWLVEQNHCDRDGVKRLIQRMITEVLEDLLLLPYGHYSTIWTPLPKQQLFCQLEIESTLKTLRSRHLQWQRLSPTITSLYQRPYIADETLARQVLGVDDAARLGRLLLSLTFRQLAVLTRRDPLALARHLVPLISDGVVGLGAPVAPFNRLPQIQPLPDKADLPTVPELPNRSDSDPEFPGLIPNFGSNEQHHWKILCVDDSPTILNEIHRLLKDHDCEVILVNDSKKALVNVIAHKPNLVLLDITMPDINGYQVCAMIRRIPDLKDMPIIMVSANSNLIDRAKAKMSGASGYMSKPFNQKELVTIVFRHLL